MIFSSLHEAYTDINIYGIHHPLFEAQTDDSDSPDSPETQLTVAVAEPRAQDPGDAPLLPHRVSQGQVDGCCHPGRLPGQTSPWEESLAATVFSLS